VTCAQNAITGAAVPLASAFPFALLAGSAITNTGFSIVTGNVGLSPGTAVSGFPPGTIIGTEDINNPVAATAEADALTAYNNALARLNPSAIPPDIGGEVLAPGVYQATTSLGVTGTLTLNGQGNPNSVFIFRMGSTLTTSVGSHIVLENGAQACNVFWQVGSSATINATSVFAGTVLALASASVGTGATVNGRLFALNAAVTLDDDAVTVPGP
jgi:hypothetical protein